MHNLSGDTAVPDAIEFREEWLTYSESIDTRLQDILVESGSLTPLDRICIGGLYWYLCETEAKSIPFSDSEIGRKGWVFLAPDKEPVDGKINIDVYGRRLASISKNSTVQLANPAKSWEGSGTLSANGSNLKISYRIKREMESGESEDSFILPPQGFDPLYPGKFRHLRPDGKFTTGTVKLKKAHLSDYKQHFTPSTSLNLFELPSTLVCKWGEAYHEVALLKQIIDKSFSHALFDIISAKYWPTSQMEAPALADKIIDDHPDSVLYLCSV